MDGHISQIVHTPGPWVITHDRLIMGADWVLVAKILTNNIKDARLIAASTKLLVALEGLIGNPGLKAGTPQEQVALDYQIEQARKVCQQARGY